MSNEEIHQISIRTVDQGDDQSGEWIVQRQGRVTASSFGEITKRRVDYAPLVIRLLYSKSRTTKAMKYGHDNEPRARDLYLEYLQKHHHNDATVQKTGFHIDFQVFTYVHSNYHPIGMYCFSIQIAAPVLIKFHLWIFCKERIKFCVQLYLAG